jgi:hypothetical protein
VRRVDYIRSRAYELARSGRHSSCASIERTLEREGFADAGMALRDPYVRVHLGSLCGSAKRHRPNPSTYLAPAPDTLPEGRQR